MGLLVGGIFRHGLHEGGIAGLVGTRLLALASLLKIEAVATAPLPGVVQVEHGHHLALAHLLEQIVESGEDCIVVNAWGLLKRRLHLGLHAALTV